MKRWIISGGNVLSGSISVSGAKNALLAIIPASIVTKSIVTLENVPPLEDTYVMIKILNKLNVRVIYDNKDKMIIDSRNVKNIALTDKFLKEIRASYYFMGSLLSLFKNVEIIGPGGCRFASRPIDLHLYAFQCLGCEVKIENSVYKFNKGKINSRIIEFNKVSVGATVNAILASVKVRGNIRLVNVALEPEIDDLINFLNRCGGNIKRVDNEIIIKGSNNYHGCKYKVMEDRIEAGTYIVMGACVGNYLKINYKESKNLKELIEFLISIGVDIKVYDKYLIINRVDKVKDCNLIFDIYPHIATDLQQPVSILMSKCIEKCVLKDNVYPSRYTQIEDLNKMGFKMEIKDDSLIVYKSDKMVGKEVISRDLRGGVSLVLAALMCDGVSVIDNVSYINRGYFNMVNKLKSIGAKIDEED